MKDKMVQCPDCDGKGWYDYHWTECGASQIDEWIKEDCSKCNRTGSVPYEAPIKVKKTRWERTYWTGYFKDGPHISSISTEEGNDLKLPELFVKKSHALKYFEEVRKVRLVEVKE